MESKINDIDMKRWKDYEEIRTTDLWLIPKRGETVSGGDSKFRGNFIPLIPYTMILRYTKEGETVLDPTSGSGTTCDVANFLKRKCYAYDINPSRDDIMYGNVLHSTYPQSNLVIFHPPYHNVIKYSTSADDLSNCRDIEVFLDRMKTALRNLDNYLSEGRYFVLVLGRIYSGGQVWDLGSRCASWLQDSGYELRGVIAKDFPFRRRQWQLERYRALKNGYWQFKYDSIYVLRKKGS